MRRITLITAAIVAVLVIAYAGWLSSANTGSAADSDDGTSQNDQDQDGGKPGEAPKD